MEKISIDLRVVNLQDREDDEHGGQGSVLLIDQHHLSLTDLNGKAGIIAYDEHQADYLNELLESIDQVCNGDYLISLDANSILSMIDTRTYLFDVCTLGAMDFNNAMKGTRKIIAIIESEEIPQLIELSDFLTRLEAHIGKWDELMYGCVIVKGRAGKVTLLYERVG